MTRIVINPAAGSGRGRVLRVAAVGRDLMRAGADGGEDFVRSEERAGLQGHASPDVSRANGGVYDKLSACRGDNLRGCRGGQPERLSYTSTASAALFAFLRATSRCE